MYKFFEELTTIIKNRKQFPSETSYISTLFSQGKDRILKKIGEEAGEVGEAGEEVDSYILWLTNFLPNPFCSYQYLSQ